MKNLKTLLLETIKKIKEDLSLGHVLKRARERKVRISSSFIRELEHNLDQINTAFAGKLHHIWPEGQPFHMEVPAEPPYKGYIIMRLERKSHPYPILLFKSVYGRDEKTGEQMEPEPRSLDFSKEVQKLKRR